MIDNNNTLFPLDSENKGNHRKTTLTQKLSWAQVKSSGLDIKQQDYVLSYLQNLSEAVCARDIEVMTGMRISSLTRVLNNLKSQNKIKVDKLGKSKHSGKPVEYYKVVNSL